MTHLLCLLLENLTAQVKETLYSTGELEPIQDMPNQGKSIWRKWNFAKVGQSIFIREEGLFIENR